MTVVEVVEPVAPTAPSENQQPQTKLRRLKRMQEYNEMMSILFFSQPPTPRSRTLPELAVNRLQSFCKRRSIE